MSTAKQLYKAAQILRLRAAAATPGPWTAGFDIQGDKDINGPQGQKICQSGVDWPTTKATDAEWIALVNPLVAEHIAGWLYAEASRRHDIRTPHSRGILGGSYGHCSCGETIIVPEGETEQCDRFQRALACAEVIINADAALEAS